MDNKNVELRVGAHVLVQLGSELVTDVEQAILECVKNSYDADSTGCRIVIDTRETGVRIETGLASKLKRFASPSESVKVTLLDSEEHPLDPESAVKDDDLIKRQLTYTGRITIEDNGDGLTPDQLQTSWLVISRSSKRGERGVQKEKTERGRTPLGDKGLGRLGSMKLGDILRIETATDPNLPLAVAQFRWTDCESARTVDEIPVFVEEVSNSKKFKGTRVSVLGLRDLSEWRRKNRINEITRSLAKLISPFEVTSTFPVGVTLDGVDNSLATITEDVLKRAIAEFNFRWETDPTTQQRILIAEARFRKRLFTSKRSQKAADRTAFVFAEDEGAGFAESLNSYSRLKSYDEKLIDLYGPWFIKLKRTYTWSELKAVDGATMTDPGPFIGAFYFFHLDNVEEPDEVAAAGIGINRNLIKGMSGISILRDGFSVRSHGDWLDLSSGMTSGSTYNMRVDNTVGYFALTGESNFHLIEKSDREGFVEDAAYRGFMHIARQCRSFANDALEQVRRGLDDYYRKQIGLPRKIAASTVAGSLDVVGQNIQSSHSAMTAATKLAQELHAEMASLVGDETPQSNPHQSKTKALQLANQAIHAIENVSAILGTSGHADLDLLRLKQAFEDRDEQAAALFESAAVGLSARGMAHELRTHLTEIRQRTAALEQTWKKGGPSENNILPHLRAIRASCTAISNATALIDPMLPRARSIKETFDLREFVEGYVKSRATSLDRAGIRTIISGAGLTVRANRPRLTQVLDNLVRNSVYWVRRASLTAADGYPKQVEIELTKIGFTVSDSGPGVDPRYEESLFEIFVTGKPDRDPGQGLGLFIVRELLQIDGCEATLLNDRNFVGRRYKFAVNLMPLAKL